MSVGRVGAGVARVYASPLQLSQQGARAPASRRRGVTCPRRCARRSRPRRAARSSCRHGRRSSTATAPARPSPTASSSVPFTNRVRIRQGLWKWTKQSFVWEVLPLAKGSACTSFATVAQTFQVDGNKVYGTDDAGATAWRCVVDRNGKSHVLVATGGKLGGVGLATVVASGLDVSRRTSAFRVSLAVTPSTVRRGRTVLVHGLAGDCTEGDAVTILSHAFAGTHSFAGVPAVLAEVGSAGRFSATTRIPASRRTGTYVVTARCGGGNLGVSAHLTVTR